MIRIHTLLTLLFLLGGAALAQEAEEKPRTFLGIRMSTEHGALEGRGVLVLEVIPGCAAEKAGVALGDVVVRFGDAKVASTDDLYSAIQGKSPGDGIEIVVLRDGEETSLSANLGAWPADLAETEVTPFPDPLTVDGIASRAGALEVDLAAGRTDGLDREAAFVRALVSFHRSTRPGDPALPRLSGILEGLEWCLALARARVQPPVNPIDGEGNAIRRVDVLVDQLGSAEFAERDRATRALRAIGPAAREALAAAAASEDPEVAHRASDLLETWEEGELREDVRPLEIEVVAAGESIELATRRGERPAGDPPLLVAVLRDGAPAGTLWLGPEGPAEGAPRPRAGDRLVAFVLDLE